MPGMLDVLLHVFDMNISLYMSIFSPRALHEHKVLVRYSPAKLSHKVFLRGVDPVGEKQLTVDLYCQFTACMHIFLECFPRINRRYSLTVCKAHIDMDLGMQLEEMKDMGRVWGKDTKDLMTLNPGCSFDEVDDVVTEDYFSYKDYVPSLLPLLLPVFSADDESAGMAVVYAVENATPHDIVGVISPPTIATLVTSPHVIATRPC